MKIIEAIYESARSGRPVSSVKLNPHKRQPAALYPKRVDGNLQSASGSYRIVSGF